MIQPLRRRSPWTGSAAFSISEFVRPPAKGLIRLLHIVGECDKRIFGLRPAERLRRQLKGRDDVEVVAHASAVMDDAALSWLIENRGTIIGSATGLPLAVSVEPGHLLDASALDGKIVAPTGEQFIRKLRRRVEVSAHSIADEPVRAVEKRLFGNVYKGVTDVVTKYAWPWPAFHVTRAVSRLGITPNMVTSVGLVMVFVAAWFFYRGELAPGLAAAWLMTFLDTVDGKLARVTVTSSPFGNSARSRDGHHSPAGLVVLPRARAGGDRSRGDQAFGRRSGSSSAAT